MKKLYITLLMAVMSFSTAFAQQDYLFTQFIVAPLSYNPAYAGSRDGLSTLALYRTQWVGVEGAPQTAFIQAHSPIGTSNLNVGLNLLNDRVGIYRFTDLALSASYKLELNNGNLHIGMSGGFRDYRADFSNQRAPQFANDPALNSFNELKPNFGFGLYYYTDNFYIGGAIPHLVNYNITDARNNTNLSNYTRHFFASTGWLKELSADVKFRPAVLFKMAPHAPVQLDLNGSFVFKDAVLAGLSLRNFETVCGIVQIYLKNNLSIGYSYDYSINGLNSLSRGSHEIFVGYDFKIGGSLVQSPRYF